ncbi:histidine kinase N-terminal 7TM domain-containing diguanylate cyclase [Actinoplanes subglobosus]|uniref:Diguanylate cyclase n=1 Tax=Actinoplanes subglobosus TaxID=1547892 RepID=A0ABV8ISI1_9ACTN
MRAALVTVYVAATLVAATYAVLCRRRRHRAPLASSLALITGGAALWSLAQAVAVGTTSLPVATAATYVMFPGVAVVVAGFLWHTIVFTGRLDQLRRWRALLLVHPVLMTAAVITDPWHHRFLTSVTAYPDGGVTVAPGPLYWTHTAYCYALIGVGTLMSVASMRRAVRGHRRVFVLFLAGALAPLIGNALTIFADLSDRQVDLTPVLFLVTATVWWWAERSGTTARRMPVAYDQVIAALSDAVMVLDPDGRVIDVNPVGAAMLAELGHVPAGTLLGRMWFEVVGPELTAAFAGGSDQQTLSTADGTVYDVRVVRMRTADGSTPGAVVVVRDVTELERLRAELTDQAVRDGLTGVYNRRHLTAALHELAVTADAEGRPLAAVMLDVDHFKAVNDTHGHAVGDEVLIRMAQEITAAVGDTGTVARYGGEEFAVILPGVSAHAAAALAEQWRRCCAEAMIATPRGPLRATFSAGVAELAPGAGVEDLLRRADHALYAAKKQGRNQVVTDTSLALRP